MDQATLGSMSDVRTNLVAYLLWGATCYGEGVIAGRNHAAHGAQQGPFQDRAVFFSLLPITVVWVRIIAMFNTCWYIHRNIFLMSHTTFHRTTGFDQFSLAPLVQQGVTEAGFSEPRPIQVQTIPAALAGADILGLAQTGTGKTAAFALPIIERLVAERRPGPCALILAPTRELAMQIHSDFERLAKFTRLKVITVFGGVSERPQVRALRDQPDIVVACPGRLLDLMRQGKAMLAQIKILVLDEADQMFDMGFLPDIKSILAKLPPRRQNLLFAATMPNEIRTLANRVLDHPHVVELAHSTPAATIEHALFRIESDQKIGLLKHLLDSDGFTSGIIFLRTKHRARRLGVQLNQMGHNAVALQGNMSQRQRDLAMEGFRQGRFNILVATDIASRGIDVAGVSHVINFDVPNTPEAYTHRIGRTGRSEQSGKAFTFVSREDTKILRVIERSLGKTICQLPSPKLNSTAVHSAKTRRPRSRKRRSTRGGVSGSGKVLSSYRTANKR